MLFYWGVCWRFTLVVELSLFRHFRNPLYFLVVLYFCACHALSVIAFAARCAGLISAAFSAVFVVMVVLIMMALIGDWKASEAEVA